MRSEDETLAGAPLCSLMLTFLSLSTREIALGEVLPGGRARWEQPQMGTRTPDPHGDSPEPQAATDQLAGCGRLGWKPQAPLHCGAGRRWRPWVGLGAGLGLRIPAAAPSSPLARAPAAPGPLPRGSGLHPAGMGEVMLESMT